MIRNVSPADTAFSPEPPIVSDTILSPGASAVRQVLPVLPVRPHPASRHRHSIAANSRFMETASFFISTSLSAQAAILFPVLQIFPEIIIFLKFVLDILLPLHKINIRLEV